MSKYEVIVNVVEKWEMRVEVEAGSQSEAHLKSLEIIADQDPHEDGECFDSRTELVDVLEKV